MIKKCAKCGRFTDDFRQDKAKVSGLASYCRPCESSYQKEYREKNAEALKVKRAERYSPSDKAGLDNWSKYRITPEQYDSLLAAQGGACAICKQPCASGKRLAVDHDHSCCPGKKSCGKCVRGLLCTRCNPALGYMKDDVALLKAAIDYLEKGQTVS